MRITLGTLFVRLLFLVGCSSGASSNGAAPETVLPPNSDAGDAPDSSDAAAPYAPSPLIQQRPYALHVSTKYDPSKPAPLILGLHGYGPDDDAAHVADYLFLSKEAEARGYVTAFPSGTKDSSGFPFWNATEACCNFENKKVDDVAYLAAVIDDVKAQKNIDPRRVYVVGWSGGAFMAHRLACELSDRLAAIVSVSGATWADASKCKPSSAVSVVEVHGSVDDTVPYDGGPAAGGGVVPSAHETVARWAGYLHCTGALAKVGDDADFELAVAGKETHLEAYSGCPQGDVELWTRQGGGHAPRLGTTWATALYDYLAAHPKTP